MTRKYTKVRGMHTHIRRAMQALGKPLPRGVEVHHHDEENYHTLVICQDKIYHQLLERRTAAVRACGHANWLKCNYCKQWDEPSRIKVTYGAVRHLECLRKHARTYRYFNTTEGK